jgi:hypothetical protein
MSFMLFNWECVFQILVWNTVNLLSSTRTLVDMKFLIFLTILESVLVHQCRYWDAFRIDLYLWIHTEIKSSMGHLRGIRAVPERDDHWKQKFP